MFPDQDLLQHVFPNRPGVPPKWVTLPWYYNAIKTFRYWHGEFYSDDEVRCLHYIVDKPWKRRPRRRDRGRDGECEKGRVYEVDAGEFEAANTPPEADAVTHGWWWEAWEEVVGALKDMDTRGGDAEGEGSLGYVEGLVDPG